MDLEQQLRSVLTDDRLDVKLAPGAVQTIHDGVRRRRRRNTAMSAAASFVLVIGGIATGVLVTQGGSDTLRPRPDQQGASQTPPPVKQVTPPARTADEVAWAAVPYNRTKPFALPGTTPDPSVASCKAGQLSAQASDFQGATGSAAGTIIVTNTGATCGLQGTPVLTGYSADGKVVAKAAAQDPFFVHPWFALRPGQSAQSLVQIFGDGSRCLGPVKRISVDLGDGAGSLSTDPAWVGGGDVQPRCGTAARSKQLDHYVAAPGDWTRRDGTPRLPMSDFSADIGQQPTTVMQGTVVRYQVLLSTGGTKVRPCLPYREQLVALDGTQTAYGTSYFRMNCAEMGHPLTQGYTLDMALPLPEDIPPGTYALDWQTPIDGLGTGAAQTIQVTVAPPKCSLDQLSVTAGGLGAATGHIRQNFVIRNTSTRTCSLRGFPGIQFVGSDGADLPTVVNWTSVAFMYPYTPKATVAMPPGAVVSFALAGVDVNPGTNPQCPTATAIKVIPPGLSDQAVVQVQWPYCMNGHVDASPIVPGTLGPR